MYQIQAARSAWASGWIGDRQPFEQAGLVESPKPLVEQDRLFNLLTHYYEDGGRDPATAPGEGWRTGKLT